MSAIDSYRIGQLRRRVKRFLFGATPADKQGSSSTSSRRNTGVACPPEPNELVPNVAFQEASSSSEEDASSLEPVKKGDSAKMAMIAAKLGFPFQPSKAVQTDLRSFYAKIVSHVLPVTRRYRQLALNACTNSVHASVQLGDRSGNAIHPAESRFRNLMGVASHFNWAV
jgi:hypothetical protein